MDHTKKEIKMLFFNAKKIKGKTLYLPMDQEEKIFMNLLPYKNAKSLTQEQIDNLKAHGVDIAIGIAP